MDPRNPLLARDFEIAFDRIAAEHVVPGIRTALGRAERRITQLVASSEEPRTWDNTVGLLDRMDEELERVIGPVAHLVYVMDSPPLREAYETVLPEFSEFYARLPLNPGVWKQVKAYAETPEARTLTGIRRRHLDKTVRGFERAGADLAPEQKERVQAIRVELSKLQTEFSNHVLDATNAWELVVTDPAELAGLPDSALVLARSSAQVKGVEGWRFTLQQPSYGPFMQYAERRELRRRMYEAFNNRATEGPSDNRPLIARILELRRELAALLGFGDYADLTLEESMAHDGAAALAFERDLTARTDPFWRREVEDLATFAQEHLALDPLEPWDVAFVGERLRRERFHLDEEELRPYFPLPRVLDGLWEISRRLFGVRVAERPGTSVWHSDVRFYEVHDEDTGTHLGSFYADWFPRESKRGGAWMNSLIFGGPRGPGDEWRPHLGLMVGNFSPPEGERPALLTHREVQTAFHEWGHLLHHLLSRVPIPARSGTNVPRDWVELPSQIMENWTWEREALDLFAQHFESGEPIPDDLFAKMVAARRFLGATFQMRQLSFGTVDLHLHVRYDPRRDGDPLTFGQGVMERFAIRPEFAHNGFLCSFSHIFAGGYAAGYYSYLWSEVLDADAFGRFQREGIFNRETGRSYVDTILSRGDSADPGALFREFMGREPDPEALLRRNLGTLPVAAAEVEGGEDRPPTHAAELAAVMP